VLRRPLTDGMLTASGHVSDPLARFADQRSGRAADPSKPGRVPDSINVPRKCDVAFPSGGGDQAPRGTKT